MADPKSHWTITKEQVNALSVTDTRRLRDSLLSALNQVDDPTSDLFEPLLFLLESSIFDRPADTLEVLAAKIQIALVSGCENDPEFLIVQRDAEAILRASA